MSEIINKVVTKHEITGQVKVTKVYPELENLTVTPTKTVQSFEHPGCYGYNNVVVKAIDCEPLIVVPQKESQSFDGMYDKVNVRAIDCATLNITPKQERQSFEGMYDKVNVDAIEADTLEVTPKKAEQSFTGLYKQVNVEAIETEEVTIEPDFSTQETVEVVATTGKYINKATVSKDPNLVPENIIKGNSVYGIEGIGETGIDTSDATATAGDIKEGKTAYVNNEKIEGTYVSETVLFEQTAGLGETKEGNPLYIEKCIDSPCEIYLMGGAKQEGTPTVNNPVDVITTGDITIGENLYIEEDSESNKYIDGSAGTTHTSSVSKTSAFIELEKTIARCEISYTNDTNIRGFCFYNENKEFISGGSSNSPFTVTKPMGAKYIRFAAPLNSKDVTLKGVKVNVEIKVDNGLDLSDENYQSYTKVLPLQQEFLRTSEYTDTFIKQSGKWYEKHYFKKYFFTGQETIQSDSTQHASIGLFYTSCLNGMKRKTWNAGYSNIGKKVESSSELSSNDNTFGLSDVNNYEKYETFWIRSSKFANYSTTNVAKELKNNYVYYPLQEPELLECTQEQQDILNSFVTYRDLTVISTKSVGNIKALYKRTWEKLLEDIADYVESEINNPVYIEDSNDYYCEPTIYGNSQYEVIDGIEGTNLMNFTSSQVSGVTVNSDGTLTINRNGGFNINFNNLTLKKGITYYQSFELIEGTITGIEDPFVDFSGNSRIPIHNFREYTPTANKTVSQIWVHGSAVFTNAKVRIWCDVLPSRGGQELKRRVVGENGNIEIVVNNSLDPTDINYKAQVKTLPIQQVMLEGDYIDKNVEHHNWTKTTAHGKDIYYKLNTPIDLELTKEQKNVLENLKTYTGQTTISVDDDLATLKIRYKEMIF